jgi:SAM-dependent methyltransferase
VCSGCGAGWTMPEASGTELASFYPEASYGYSLEHGALGVVQRLLQRMLFAYVLARPPLRALADQPPSKLLDVGCGRGDLGEALVRRGWHVAGVEPSPDACAYARRRGVQASTGTLETVSFDAETFDAVVMRHSLEHVPDPIGDLERVRSVLRPDGLLAISVPNFSCWERTRFGAAWFHLDLPRHRTHFTPRALELALRRTGFDVCGLSTSGDLSSLLSTLQYRTAGRLLWTGAPAFWTTSALGLLLSPLTALANRAQGGGPVLHALARRASNDS